MATKKERKPSKMALALAAAVEKAEKFESRFYTALEERNKQSEDLRAVRSELNEARGALSDLQHRMTDLNRQLGRLEGYKQRVSDLDMLEHKLTPMHRGERDTDGAGVVSSLYPPLDMGRTNRR